MTVPKPQPFDAQTFQEALDTNIRRPDGKPYQVFTQFRGWKLWVDQLRDFVETHRVRLNDQKRHLDENTTRIGTLEQKVAALEARPASPFPGSG